MSANTARTALCCTALDAVLAADDYEPCLTVDDDGVLCLTVGITDLEEEDPTLVLEPMIFCPFCGTRLQAGRIEDEAGTGGHERN
jgi:hypothetical protein